MLVDRTELFLERMATVVGVAQWAYSGNQLAKRTKHLSKENLTRLVQLIDEQENQEPVVQ